MASRGVNKVILIGNLGNDPETRYFPDGGAVTNASIATSETWKDKQTGEPKERTEWHRVVFKDRGNYKLGQWAGEWLKKGSKVFIEGQLQTRKWQDQSGQDRYATEIIATDMQSLDPREAVQRNTAPGGAPGGAPAPAGNQPSPPPSNQPMGAHNRNSQPAPAQDFNDFDDDIPF